jgi:hypothetical protein
VRELMTEKVELSLGAFKIWRNPTSREEPIEYMGDFYPPDGRGFFTSDDLHELGFAPGCYTVLVPESARGEALSKWQKVSVSDDQSH